MATPSKPRRKTPMPTASAPPSPEVTLAPKAAKAARPAAKAAAKAMKRSVPGKRAVPVLQAPVAPALPVAPPKGLAKRSTARKAAPSVATPARLNPPVQAAEATKAAQKTIKTTQAAKPTQSTKATLPAATATAKPPALATLPMLTPTPMSMPAPAPLAQLDTLVPASKRARRQAAPRKPATRAAPPAQVRPAPVTTEAPAEVAVDDNDTAQAVLAVLVAGTLPVASPAASPVSAPVSTPAQTAAEVVPRADQGNRPSSGDKAPHVDRPDRNDRPARGRGRDRDRSQRPDANVRQDLGDRADRPTRTAAPALTPTATLTPTPTPTLAHATALPPLAANGQSDSSILLVDGDQRHIAWLPGHACPLSLQQAAAARLDGQQQLAPDDDAALPTLQRLAAEAGHTLRVDEAVWPHLAAHRDARHRLGRLEAAYPDGPASAALAGLLRSPLPLYQAEGALFAVVAGRALLADERGLGKGVQAIAAALLWQRHFGVNRVLVLCATGQSAAWQRAWQRFAGTSGPLGVAQVMAGGLHQRQAQWATAAGVRILSPEALASDAAHLLQWAPALVIVDEPQHLGLQASDWATLAAPQALVLCGAPLAEQPELMQTLVSWLDNQRLGPLAALNELREASARGAALTEADIERLTDSLSRLMLQRLRADLADQLPPLVHTERLLMLAPGQRAAHDQALADAQRLLAGWQRSGYLADADQWRLALALRAMQQACHRADPTDPHSALAEATLQALARQLAEWAGSAGLADPGVVRVAVLCATPADRDQLAARLPVGPNLMLLLPDDTFPAGLHAVVQAGVPWRTRRSPAGPRAQTTPGQQWVYLVAQDSLDAGLFDTLADRLDLPRSLADGGGRDFLQGDRLDVWLLAVQAALPAPDHRVAAPAP